MSTTEAQLSMLKCETETKQRPLLGSDYGTISWCCPEQSAKTEVKPLTFHCDSFRGSAPRYRREAIQFDQGSEAVASIIINCLTVATAAGSCISLLRLNGITHEVERGTPTIVHTDNTYLVALAVYIFNMALFCHLRRLAGDTSIRASLSAGILLGTVVAALLALDNIQALLLYIPGTCWIALMLAWAWSAISSSRLVTSETPSKQSASLFANAEKMEGGDPSQL